MIDAGTIEAMTVTQYGPGEDEQLWTAIAEPSRRRLLDALLAGGEATATVLAEQMPLTRQAVAKHLAVLERADLVEARRAGREVRYAVRPQRLDAATRAMAQVAARWDSRLQAIKRLAEAAHREQGGGEQGRSEQNRAERQGPKSTGRDVDGDGDGGGRAAGPSAVAVS